MAGADIIEAAIGITLLLIVSYVVLGSITTAADTVSTAKKDMTLLQEERLGTSITIADYHYDKVGLIYGIDFRVLNNGNQVIRNINKTEVFFYNGSGTPQLYINGSGTFGTNTWKRIELERDSAAQGHNEIINKMQWDPGECLYGKIEVNYLPSNVDLLDVILANGVKASTTTAIYQGS
jgi:hypothetical protein